MFEAITHPEVIFELIVAIAIFGISYVVFGLVHDSGTMVNDKMIKTDKQKKAEEKKLKKTG